MANHVIPEEPSLNTELRKLETTDKAHADTFNTLFAQLIENDAALNKKSEGLSQKVTDSLGEGGSLSEMQTELDGKANSADLTKHTGDTTIHITAEERTKWDGKTDDSGLKTHAGDTTIHITADERTKWNGKADGSHTHVAANISDGAKTWAPLSHTHAQTDITDLAKTLEGKAASAHKHAAGDITSGVLAVANGGTGAGTLDAFAMRRAPVTVAVTTADWAAGTGFVSHKFTATGVNSTNKNAYVANLVQSGTEATDAASREAFGAIIRGVVSAENEVTLYALQAPAAAFSLQLIQIDATAATNEIAGFVGGGAGTSINGAAVTVDKTSFVYNGAAQAPKVTKVSFQGKDLKEGEDYAVFNIPQTAAGSYSMTTFGVQKYTGGVKTSWAITKAAGSVAAAPAEVSIQGLEKTATVTLTVVGDGAITFEGCTHTTAACTDRKTVTITGKSEGTDTITVKLADGANYTGSTCKITATVKSFQENFADNGWDAIADAAASGQASTLWNAGDVKDVTIGGVTYQAQIIGFNHDDLDSTDAMYGKSEYNGGTNKAAVTFQLKDCLNDTKRMHSSNDNSMSWEGTEMRKTTLPGILSGMDSAFSGSIRKVVKKTATSSSNSTIKNTADQLFLLSEIEVFGKATYSHAGEGTQYEFWKANNTNNARIKKVKGSAVWWWLRSPYTSASSAFCAVGSVGASNSGATDPYGVAFGFCL